MDAIDAIPAERPRNGLAGLEQWRHDLAAGLLVSLISLPFSLGIAVASGAPPVAGLVSSILAGLVMPFLGGSYVTVSGPAAGLAPALLAAMTVLGRGDLKAGYPLLLVAVCLTGVVQVALSRLKAARFSAMFPTAVVEGMLASIGLLIIAKQLPHLIGHDFHAHEFFGILREAPRELGRLEPRVFLVGMACLAMVFGLGSLKARWLKAVPPQVITVAFGLVLGRLLGLGGHHLVHIPENVLENGIVTPDFRGLFADRSLWLAAATAVVTLTLIDGVEGLATIAAIDRIDPFRRKSDPDRTLFAMGVAKICSGLAGGLTIIPGGVKSTACIQGGGRTLWANFYNALFLIAFLFLGHGVINMIPLGALAAILVFTGYKLCRPAVWRHVGRIGSEQLLVFSLTVLVTLSTDLLWGIAAGVGAKLLLSGLFAGRAAGRSPDGPATASGRLALALGQVGALFRNPIVAGEQVGDAYHLTFGGPLACFNSMQVSRELAKIPAGATAIELRLTDAVTLIDHTSFENLMHFAEETERAGRGHVALVGLDAMRRRSSHASCMRLAAPRPGSAPGQGVAHPTPRESAEIEAILDAG